MSAKRQPFVSPAMDYATELDRRWFLAHPGATARFRPLIKGEFLDLLAAGCNMVLVRQLAPGVRARMGMRARTPGDETGWITVAEDGAVVDQGERPDDGRAS